MEINYRYLGYLLIAVIMCFATLALITPKVDASETNATVSGNQTIGNYTPGEQAPFSRMNTTNGSIRIMQGQCVALGGTYDIAGLGWNTEKIVWFGKWYDAYAADDAEYIRAEMKIPTSISALSAYYIDPDYFGDKLGFWYMNYPDYEPQGNSRMFQVNITCPPPPIVYYNATPSAKAEIEQLGPLPDKYESDILLAKGDNLGLNESATARWWLFGSNEIHSKYDQQMEDGTVKLLTGDTDNYEPGIYDLVIVDAGKNEILEEMISADGKEIISPFRSVNPVNIYGLQPKTVEQRLNVQVSKSIDDKTHVWKLSLQDPAIQITRLDELTNITGMHFYDFRGYTNVEEGTDITIKVDERLINNETERYKVYHTKAVGDKIGYWRQFQIVIPVDYNEIFPGKHTITATTESGARMDVEIYIYKEPAPHYQPANYTEYVGRNPFIPTPTPITITKEVQKVVTQVVVQTVAPSDAQVKAQQDIVIGEKVNSLVIAGIIIAVLLAGIYFGGKWALSIYRRMKV